MTPRPNATRRAWRVLPGLVLGVALATAVPVAQAAPRMAAARMTALEKSNALRIQQYLETLGNDDKDPAKLAAFFADDCEFILADGAPVKGKANVLAFIGTFLAKWGYDFDVHEIYSKGPVVVTYRHDAHTQDGKVLEKPFAMVGVYVMKDGKIARATSYGADPAH